MWEDVGNKEPGRQALQRCAAPGEDPIAWPA